MGAAIITVRKEVDGKGFYNTYCAYVGDPTTPLTEAELLSMVDIGLLGADQNAAVSPQVVNAIVDFEMQIMSSFVRITDVYVTDGRNYVEGPDPSTLFLSKNLFIVGNRTVVAREGVQPGDICLQVKKVPAGLSVRPGFCDYRLVLFDEHVTNTGLNMKDFNNLASAQIYSTLVNNALTASGLDTHFVGGANVAGGIIAVPHYQRASDPPTPQDGNLIGATGLTAMVVSGVYARQVKRGRKEK